MSGFLFAFIACLLAGIGARDQLTVAGLAARQGQRPLLLAVAVLTSVATAGIAAWAGFMVLPILAGNTNGGLILAALATAFAGGEMLLLRSKRLPDEPTQSLGATAIVLTAHQLTDAGRFFVFALAVATAAPIPAGLGGAVGGAMAVTSGWIAGEALPARQVGIVRWVIGALLLVLAAWLALRGLGRF